MLFNLYDSKIPIRITSPSEENMCKVNAPLPRELLGCTSVRGHIGPHVAEGTTYIIAVWTDD